MYARKKAAPVGGCVQWLVSLCVRVIQSVGVELHHLFTNMLVDLSHRRLQRLQFVGHEYPRRLLDVAKAAGVLRDDAHQLGWDTMASQLVVAGDVLGLAVLRQLGVPIAKIKDALLNHPRLRNFVPHCEVVNKIKPPE